MAAFAFALTFFHSPPESLLSLGAVPSAPI